MLRGYTSVILTAFERAVADLPDLRLAPRCDQADTVYAAGREWFDNRIRYGAHKLKLPNRLRYSESGVATKTVGGLGFQIDGVDVAYSLMVERGRHVRRVQRALGPTIMLAVNRDPFQSSALMLPPNPNVGRAFAAIVVGDVVNDPEIMDGMLPIIEACKYESQLGASI